MKNVIIAIDDIKKYSEIKMCFYKTEYNVFDKDLIYEDAIYEIMEKINVDILIIHSKIIKNPKYLNKFRIKKNVDVYVFVEDYIDVDNFKKLGFKYIYKDEDLNKYFIDKKVLNKKDVFETNNFQEINKFKNELTLIKNNFDKKYKSEIIVITGESKVGKTSLALKMLEYIDKKVLYLRFDNKYNILNYIKGKDNVRENIKEKICIKNVRDELKRNTLKNLINEYKKIFDIILIDLNYNIEFKYLKFIFLVSNKIYFIIYPEQKEISNFFNVINFFKQNSFINEDKVFIVFNKYNYKSICVDILKEIFKDYKIESVVREKNKYRKILNKEVKIGFRTRRC